MYQEILQSTRKSCNKAAAAAGAPLPAPAAAAARGVAVILGARLASPLRQISVLRFWISKGLTHGFATTANLRIKQNLNIEGWNSHVHSQIKESLSSSAAATSPNPVGGAVGKGGSHVQRRVWDI